MSVVFPGCCRRLSRPLIRHELGAWSVMMMPLNWHFFLVLDIFLIDSQWPIVLIMMTIKSIVWVLEGTRVVEVPGLNFSIFHILFQHLHGLSNLVRRLQWKGTLRGKARYVWELTFDWILCLYLGHQWCAFLSFIMTWPRRQWCDLIHWTKVIRYRYLWETCVFDRLFIHLIVLRPWCLSRTVNL